MKTNVLRQADETMKQPAPTRRTRTRVIGITIAIVSLLIVGSAGTALATGLIPSPFSAPKNPVTTSTPSLVFTPTTTPTAPTTSSPTTPTKKTDDPSDPSTWVIGFDHVGPVHLGMTPAEVSALIPSLASPAPELSCVWRNFEIPQQVIIWAGLQGSEADPVSFLMVSPEPSNPTYTLLTDRGIGAGSTPAEVAAAYPQATTPENSRGDDIIVATDSRGNMLQFYIDPNTSTVSEIYVAAAGFNSANFACD
ncbi:hypothetical protein KPL76_10810 [Subtercola sp. PAMC28395]|uniref:hypothetical protein n=1 Tax=Subtercola sp. PAMC28395 TaxID=2846775 RepID=UPI001C0D8BC6|nr:hypothetical protein [Subtercola sp. PAMC28395]QWT23224.1 hypothetical protein KPL76_10810 [Subtercola sp. PAMC28395]